MQMTDAIAYVRRDIGDPAQAFYTKALSDGMTLLYDLPPQNINPVNLTVQVVTAQGTTNLLPTAVPGSVTLENSFGTTSSTSRHSTALIPRMPSSMEQNTSARSRRTLRLSVTRVRPPVPGNTASNGVSGNATADRRSSTSMM